jgi:hypothetical protein
MIRRAVCRWLLVSPVSWGVLGAIIGYYTFDLAIGFVAGPLIRRHIQFSSLNFNDGPYMNFQWTIGVAFAAASVPLGAKIYKWAHGEHAGIPFVALSIVVLMGSAFAASTYCRAEMEHGAVQSADFSQLKTSPEFAPVLVSITIIPLARIPLAGGLSAVFLSLASCAARSHRN